MTLSTADLLVRVRTIQAGLKVVEEQLKTQLAVEMAPGDRRYGTGVVADGKVTMSKGGEWIARVTDLQRLTQWVVEHYPENVRPAIKDWFLDDIKAASVKAEAAVGPGGEMLPDDCLVVTKTWPEMVIWKSRDGTRLVAEKWAELVAGMPALPGGE